MRKIVLKLALIALLLFFIIMLLINLTSCNVDTPERKVDGDPSLILLEEYNYGFDEYYQIFYHEDTKVMYLFIKSGYGGGLTIMLDENGNPLIYEGN